MGGTPLGLGGAHVDSAAGETIPQFPAGLHPRPGVGLRWFPTMPLLTVGPNKCVFQGTNSVEHIGEQMLGFPPPCLIGLVAAGCQRNQVPGWDRTIQNPESPKCQLRLGVVGITQINPKFRQLNLEFLTKVLEDRGERG